MNKKIGVCLREDKIIEAKTFLKLKLKIKQNFENFALELTQAPSRCG